jgi:hypothetical protein
MRGPSGKIIKGWDVIPMEQRVKKRKEEEK